MSDNILYNPPPEYLVEHIETTVIQEAPAEFLETEVQDTIITVRKEPTIIVTAEQGPAGPPGPAGEGGEEVNRTILTDQVGADTMYKGESIPGSGTTADPVWRVSRMVIAEDGDISVLYAGSGAMDQIWDNRLSLTYSP